MYRYAGFALGFCLLTGSGHLCAQTTSGQMPTVAGYIGAISGTDFYVNGKKVVSNAQTVFSKHEAGKNGSVLSKPFSAKTLTVGDNVNVYGNMDRHTHAIVASEVDLDPDPAEERVKGFAVVQRVIAASPELLLEADGYSIAVPPKTQVRYTAPLKSRTAPAANLWIAYSGRWNDDGEVVATHLTWSKFRLSPRLKKGLKKSQEKLIAPVYRNNPAESGKPGSFEAPYVAAPKHTVAILADAEIQKRVQTLGERLIPASQKNLPEGDPQKIHFQFFAVDDNYMDNASGSPSGIVIISAQTIHKLRNDDQVAAVLAQGVAEALEWQVPPPVMGSVGPTMLALGQMPFVGPVAGLALESGAIYEMEHENYPNEFNPLQNARVGLSLMRDAGFDVFQAPLAWQILKYGGDATDAARKPDTPQTGYLLSVLGLEHEKPRAANSE